MRKFTKTHNDLNWLFQDPTNDATGEDWFNKYEDLASTLLESCYGYKQTFNRDDMIDAFMKGASEAHTFLSCKVYNAEMLKELRNQNAKQENEFNELLKSLK